MPRYDFISEESRQEGSRWITMVKINCGGNERVGSDTGGTPAEAVERAVRQVTEPFRIMKFEGYRERVKIVTRSGIWEGHGSPTAAALIDALNQQYKYSESTTSNRGRSSYDRFPGFNEIHRPDNPPTS